MCAQGGSVTDEPQVAERVEKASLTVNAPRCLVVADLVDAAICSGCHGTFDETVWVANEDLRSHRSRTTRGRSVPAVVRGLAQEEWAPSTVNPTTLPRFHSSVAPSACAYQRAAAAASGTASITEITGP